MKKPPFKTRIRELVTGEPIPYDLLLLADETKEAIDKYISVSDIFVMEKNKVIIAVYVFYRLTDYQVEIKNIAVARDFQHMGIGNLLLADAATRAMSVGYREIIVGTPEVSQSLIQFYIGAGFTVYGKRANFYIDHYPDPIIENGLQLVDMVMLKKVL